MYSNCRTRRRRSGGSSRKKHGQVLAGVGAGAAAAVSYVVIKRRRSRRKKADAKAKADADAKKAKADADAKAKADKQDIIKQLQVVKADLRGLSIYDEYSVVISELTTFRERVDELFRKYDAITQHEAAMDDQYDKLKIEINAEITEIGERAKQADDEKIAKHNNSWWSSLLF